MVDDFSILKKAWELYNAELDSRDERDYEVDEVQMKKFIDAYGVFLEIAADNDGVVEDIKIAPKETCGGIIAYFDVMYLTSNDVGKFSEVIKEASGFSIDSTLDHKVCVSLTIPGIFRKKSN